MMKSLKRKARLRLTSKLFFALLYNYSRPQTVTSGRWLTLDTDSSTTSIVFLHSLSADGIYTLSIKFFRLSDTSSASFGQNISPANEWVRETCVHTLKFMII